MFESLSLLNLAAVGLYLAVVACALAAGLGSVRYRQQGWHLRVWIMVVLLFLALVALRGLGIEELWRDELRMMLRADGAYESRRDIQRPIAAIVIAVAGGGAFISAYQGVSQVRGRRNGAAMVAAASVFVMIALVALRLISLHPVDALLYGPFKLNWIIDIGSSMAAAGAAVYYLRLVRQRP